MVNRPEFTLVLALLICSFTHQCASYGESENDALSILLVPFPAPSHMMGMATFGEELIRRGHNVTFCVAQIRREYVNIGKEIARKTGMNFLTTLPSNEPRPSSDLYKFQLMKMVKIHNIVDFTSRLSRISQQLVKTLDNLSKGHWNIVIGEDLLWPLVGTIARKWSVPVVHFSNSLDFQHRDLPFWSYPIFGTGYTDDLTVLQRLYLTLLSPIEKVVVNVFETTLLRSGGLNDIRPYILPGTMTPFIVTTSFGFEYPRPLLPLFHYVGPMIEKENIDKPLEGPLQSWLDSRRNSSVVLISMGTTAHLSDSEGIAIANGILATPFSALWSLRDTRLQGLVRSSVGHQNEHRFFLAEWLPQQTILRHSSIAVAILHGGMGGVAQCLYNGIPEIIIPSALDRDDLSARVVSRGAGLRMYKHEITTKTVSEAISTVSSSQYREAALMLRKTFRLSGGAERAADLVEYYADVGYEHLVPAYAKYKWNCIQYYDMDVYVLLLVIVLLTIYGLLRVSKCCCKHRSKCLCKLGDSIKGKPSFTARRGLYLTVFMVTVCIILCTSLNIVYIPQSAHSN